MHRDTGLGGHKILIGVVAVAAVVAGVLVSYVTSRQEAPEIDGLLWPQSKALQELALVDQHGRPFTLDRLEGRWTLLFFGYTHCPDVCPITLSVLKNAKTRMAESGAHSEPVQVVFVSVDPERDTLEHMGAYVTHFDPEFLGVTGEEAGLKDFSRQLGVLYIRADPDGNGDYLVDHTAAVFLIDPRGHLVALFQAPHSAERIARDVPRIQQLEWN